MLRAEVDEVIRAEDLCDHDERNVCAAISNKQLAHLRASSRGWANRLKRRLLAQKEPRLGIISKRASRSRAAWRGVVQPIPITRSLQNEKEATFRDPVVTCLLGQFGSIAADRSRWWAATGWGGGGGGGPPRSRAHAGALAASRSSENSGRAHPRLKGGNRARPGLHAGKRPIPVASTISVTFITKSAEAPCGRARKNLGPDDARGPVLRRNSTARRWTGRTSVRGRGEQPQDPDDDIGRRAGRRFQRCRSIPAYLQRHLRHIIEEDRDPLAGRVIAMAIGHDVTRYIAALSPSWTPKSSAAPSPNSSPSCSARPHGAAPRA